MRFLLFVIIFLISVGLSSCGAGIKKKREKNPKNSHTKKDVKLSRSRNSKKAPPTTAQKTNDSSLQVKDRAASLSKRLGSASSQEEPPQAPNNAEAPNNPPVAADQPPAVVPPSNNQSTEEEVVVVEEVEEVEEVPNSNGGTGNTDESVQLIK